MGILKAPPLEFSVPVGDELVVEDPDRGRPMADCCKYPNLRCSDLEDDIIDYAPTKKTLESCTRDDRKMFSKVPLRQSVFRRRLSIQGQWHATESIKKMRIYFNSTKSSSRWKRAIPRWGGMVVVIGFEP